MLLNLAILFAVANLIAIALIPYFSAPQRHAWLIDKYGFDLLSRGYPGWKRSDLQEFLFETSNWVSTFEPFTQFKPAVVHERFINMSPDGFRIGAQQSSWPPASSTINVFFFGGSTTMGVGVPDRQTIPSYFQIAANQCSSKVAVYNFGRGLFEQLLLKGRVPTVAIFLDGLNDSSHANGEPQWTSDFRQYMATIVTGYASEPDLGRLLTSRLPIAQLISLMSHREPGLRDVPDTVVPDTSTQMTYVASRPVTITPDIGDLQAAQAVVDRMRVNRQMIEALATRFGVKTLFVLQPVPMFGYDLRYMNVFKGDANVFGEHLSASAVYALLEKNKEDRIDTLWLGDIQRGFSKNLYVDRVHYTAAFNDDIGRRILSSIIADGFISCDRK